MNSVEVKFDFFLFLAIYPSSLDHLFTKNASSCTQLDEDITPSDTTIDYKVSSFLHLHNGKTKNWLLPNMGISNVLRNNGDDDK